jgi:phenylacetate-coenzyme A ligase PaaK-like adenylate-forming protein
MQLNTPSYLDLCWDTMDHDKREQMTLESAKQTALFAKRSVPFYKHHFQNISESTINNITTLSQFAFEIPETTKLHLSNNHYRSFLPECRFHDERDIHKGAYRNKSTGGTTSSPVTVIYTAQDWRAMAQHIARSIKFDFKDRLNELENFIVCGLYHGDHVTNEIYQAGMNLLGMDFFNRVSTKQNDTKSNFKFIQRTKPNGILAPPEDSKEKQTKGITLDKILQMDAVNAKKHSYRFNQKINTEFKAIFWSSMPMSMELYDYLKNHLGIPYIQGQYGSTEICPTGATCCEHPTGFHLGYGPALVLTCSEQRQQLAEEGEMGYLLVTKCGATDEKGENYVPSGTTLINFRTGDSAKLVQQQGQVCGCGRNTPVLVDLERTQYREAKSNFGCQVD